MNKLLANFLLLICYGSLLLSQPTHGLRIKRSNSLANAATNNNINLKANLTGSPLPLAPTPVSVTAAVVDKPQVKIMETTQAAVGNEIVAAATEAAATKATTAAAVAEPAKKLVQLDEAQANELAGHMRRGKRRMSLNDELPKAAHHGRHHNGGSGGGSGGAGIAPPPFVYFNKLVSPDDKQELKQFQLLGPNVVIESVQQHDMNYPPNGDLGGVLLLNADSNLNGRGKPKHHHKHKSSLALPPFLFMLQQLLQPNLNVDLDLPTQRNRLDSPLYQFVDSAVDNALRNREMFEREIELNEKEDKKDRDREITELMSLTNKDYKGKESIEVPTNRKDDELVVSCPIHHDHHANNNGEIVDDDVVLVNECHIV